MALPEHVRLLAAVADALNACERAGLPVELEHGAVMTSHGYVLPARNPLDRDRWAARPKVDAAPLRAPLDPKFIPPPGPAGDGR